MNEGDVLFAVTPDSITGIYGELLLPYEYRDKIQQGPQVKIELTSYPSNIYGVLRGTIDKIYPLAVTANSSSNVQTATADNVNLVDVKPVGPTFLKVKIILPQGLTTSDGRQLHFTPALRGTATVILSKHSLLMRLFGRN